MRYRYRQPILSVIVLSFLFGLPTPHAKAGEGTAEQDTKATAAKTFEIGPIPQNNPRFHSPKLPPQTAEERALLEIRKESWRRVREIAEQLRGMEEGPSRQDLERRALEIKRDYRVRFLETKASFARTRGELATAHELERLIERILHPRSQTVAPFAGQVKKDAEAKEGRHE